MLMKKTNEDLEKLLAVFKRGTLEDFFTLSSYLNQNDISVKELDRYLIWKREQAREVRRFSREEDARKRKGVEEQIARWRKKVRKCPKCNTPLILSKISTLKGKSNIRGWRSLWSCPSEDCLFEEYSKEFADKIYTELMEG